MKIPIKKRVTMDFETRSASNLKAEGAYKYSLDPSTQPTCLAWKSRHSPYVWFLNFKMINTPWAKLPTRVRQEWTSYLENGFEFSAHNAFFETCIYTNILVARFGWPPSRSRAGAARPPRPPPAHSPVA
jgi:DNA polymerase